VVGTVGVVGLVMGATGGGSPVIELVAEVVGVVAEGVVVSWSRDSQ
jgi:hypothetical protein